jgi:sterol desaturase/sphingolipid hydroxylase (fatty acid hydroxylase superfamily)
MTSALEPLWALGERAASALLKPATFLYDPSKRVFWGYLLLAFLIAGLVLVVRERKQWRARLYEQLLSPRVWLHPSSLLDMKLMLAKSLARALLFAPWLLSSYGLAIAVVRLANGQFGVADPTSLSPSLIAILYTVGLFVSSDGSRYLLHRLCHEVPLLWQFHQVHHSAEVMTPLTLYRSHPVENFFFVLRGVVVTGFVTGTFFYVFGVQAVQYQFLGVNVLGLLFNMFGANLRHSPVWISYGSFVEHVLLSPAQHQIHHSVQPEHFGSNYGSCLALWDWLGGSLRVAAGKRGVSFGLDKRESNHNPHALGSALVGPFKGCWRLISKRLRVVWAVVLTHLKF